MRTREVKLGEILNVGHQAQGRDFVRALHEAAIHLEFSLHTRKMTTVTAISVETLDETTPEGAQQIRVTAHCVEEFDEDVELWAAVARSIHEAKR